MSQNVSKILPDAKMVKKDQNWPKKPKTNFLNGQVHGQSTFFFDI